MKVKLVLQSQIKYLKKQIIMEIVKVKSLKIKQKIKI